ncbi:hypothetical protein VB711_19080 [Cronbergia sp. UHCC 0137]|uniref:hypothetical protein n=1 Tax=Cronbergia sp. UHCC 0137 TaxID=3110239 RepID=UPI002B1EDF87|nr:hypothetical protein [Cronbergia sp. UHCC 0137]MEA5619932.1 hypothetical protein [Cronbergia sp. UHCC 0137]
MAIKIPRKFGSALPPEEPREKGVNFHKINEKFRYERENIQPHLGDLYGFYGDRCVIFNGNYYVGRNGYSFRSGKNEDYDKVGKILVQI